jgi:ABC-2 type transport system permease protein
MSKRNQAIVQGVLFLGIVVFLNILGSIFYGYLDLTEEKRYTLTEPTRKLLNGLDDVVDIHVLLEGEFPAGFKRLQRSVKEVLEDFRSESGYVEYIFEDPSEGTVNEVNQRRENLAKDGITPVNLRLKATGETTEKLIYPYAIFNYGNRQIAVNFLENETPGLSPEEVLNNSISLLEFKFANAIQKLKSPSRPTIIFTTGKGELQPLQTRDLEETLYPFYNVGRVDLDTVVQIPQAVDILMIARPRAPFSMKEKFLIDQYVMNGGKVIWMLDRLNVHLDSLRRTNNYVPYDYELNLEDILFKYGVRIQPNLVLDLECSRIPQVIGTVGNAPQIEYFPWFYHPLATPKSDHPIVKGLDRVNFFFPSSIDTVASSGNIRKTTLLSSSRYSRLQLSPVRLNFEILRYEPDPVKFNKSFQNLAVLLEGEFPSFFQNRLTTEMQASLDQLNLEYKGKSIPTKMIVISDGDIAKNPVNPETGAFAPLGYNRYDRYTYANKDFLVNAIEYLLDEEGVIRARTKEVKLRLLDAYRAKEEKTKWQLINIGLPVVFLLLFGFLFNTIRKRKYT